MLMNFISICIRTINVRIFQKIFFENKFFFYNDCNQFCVEFNQIKWSDLNF